MKRFVLWSLFIISLEGYSQSIGGIDEERVKVVVNQFFEALETQDTVLLKSVSIPHGQIWSKRNNTAESNYSSRLFRDDLTMFNPTQVYKEKPLDFDIRIHNGMAMAWVPYEFYINEDFSHCGVDIFTLMKEQQHWKIVNLSYTVDTDGCDELRSGR